MIGLLRSLLRLRGAAGVVALAVAFGTGVGLLVTHAVLAAWTYRDAARRDLRAPGRWSLAVLVGGIFVFVPYVLLTEASDWSNDSRPMGAVRRVLGRGPAGRDPEVDAASGGVADGAVVESASGTGTPTSEAADQEGPVNRSQGTTAEPRPDQRNGGRSLALATARYGWKAARLGGRGARWAAGWARRELAD